jgi:ABC-type multidrug transport system fused ATPase/permease subunit
MGLLLDGLEAEAYDRSYNDGQLLRRIGGYLRPERKNVIVVIGLIVLYALFNSFYPFFISRILDTLTISNPLPITLLLVGIILLSSVISWVCNLFRFWLTARMAGNVMLHLSEDAFASTIEQDMSFFDRFSSSKIARRIASDTKDMAKIIMLMLNLLSQILVFLCIAIMLFCVSWRLALLTCSILPVIIVVTLIFRMLARRMRRYTQRSLANIQAHIQEAINGITIAKNFRQEERTYRRFQHINEQSYRITLRTGFLYACIFPIFGIIAYTGTAIIIYSGGLYVIERTISLGEWFLFVQCISLLWGPLTSISSFWSQFQQGLAAGERVFALLDAESRLQQIDQRPVTAVAGKIEFKHVYFSYNESQTVLANLHLAIQPRETVAFVGHTGAGKTSIARLIARFYEFQGGELLIDGQDIRTLDVSSYRRYIGIVPQSPFLFSGSVADNIRYIRSSATDEEVLAAAQCVAGGDWVRALPNGLDTYVGEGGKELSLGQRQLVALARIMLQDPAIVILDEATASVDPLTEAQIQEGLAVVLRNRTAILIAHRLLTVKRADRIIVLDRGRIIEEGNHERLLQRGGNYARLYNTYFRHQLSSYKPGEGFVPVLTVSAEKQTTQDEEKQAY